MNFDLSLAINRNNAKFKNAKFKMIVCAKRTKLNHLRSKYNHFALCILHFAFGRQADKSEFTCCWIFGKGVYVWENRRIATAMSIVSVAVATSIMTITTIVAVAVGMTIMRRKRVRAWC